MMLTVLNLGLILIADELTELAGGLKHGEQVRVLVNGDFQLKLVGSIYPFTKTTTEIGVGNGTPGWVGAKTLTFPLPSMADTRMTGSLHIIMPSFNWLRPTFNKATGLSTFTYFDSQYFRTIELCKVLRLELVPQKLKTDTTHHKYYFHLYMHRTVVQIRKLQATKTTRQNEDNKGSLPWPNDRYMYLSSIITSTYQSNHS